MIFQTMILKSAALFLTTVSSCTAFGGVKNCDDFQSKEECPERLLCSWDEGGGYCRDKTESNQCNLYNDIGNTMAAECVEAGCFWDVDGKSPFCSSSEPASVKCDGKNETSYPSDCFWHLQRYEYDYQLGYDNENP